MTSRLLMGNGEVLLGRGNPKVTFHATAFSRPPSFPLPPGLQPHEAFQSSLHSDLLHCTLSRSTYLSCALSHTHTHTHTHRDRQTHTHRERQTHTHTHTQRERQTHTDTHTHTHTHRPDRQTDRHTP